MAYNQYDHWSDDALTRTITQYERDRFRARQELAVIENGLQQLMDEQIRRHRVVTEKTAHAEALPMTLLSDIKVGMRLSSAAQSNQAIVTSVESWGFIYDIPDDENIVSPHWSMKLIRRGHNAFAVNGMVHWVPVATNCTQPPDLTGQRS